MTTFSVSGKKESKLRKFKILIFRLNQILLMVFGYCLKLLGASQRIIPSTLCLLRIRIAVPSNCSHPSTIISDIVPALIDAVRFYRLLQPGKSLKLFPILQIPKHPVLESLDFTEYTWAICNIFCNLHGAGQQPLSLRSSRPRFTDQSSPISN